MSRIAVLIPTYQQETVIGEGISSVIAQLTGGMNTHTPRHEVFAMASSLNDKFFSRILSQGMNAR